MNLGTRLTIAILFVVSWMWGAAWLNDYLDVTSKWYRFPFQMTTILLGAVGYFWIGFCERLEKKS